MSESRRTVVSVEIAGEEYSIRTEASEEYTRECAAYVDRMVGEILSAGSLLQPHKAAILAALAITDELFQAQRSVLDQREDALRRAGQLAGEIERRLGDRSLATHS